MQHLKLEDGSIQYPYTTLFADNPNISFPSILTDSILAQFGVLPVEETPKPVALWWEDVQEVTPILHGGIWRQAWEVFARPTSERATLTEKEWAKVRDERDARLAACDWTQLPDSPTASEAWAVYRQALRNLPENTTNPFEVVWPLQP